MRDIFSRWRVFRAKGANELENIEEAFLTGTIKKVLPVSNLNNKVIGSIRPGPVTQKLMKTYETVLEKGYI